MSNVNISLDMSLPIPIPTVDPGPDWAYNINSCLTIIDSHNHSAGQGVQITPDGLNISSDLPFGGNNAYNLKSARFSPQLSVLSGPSDLGCLYVSGVDLYYNDENGVQIRLTQSGSPSGGGGSITGLTAPASASYVGGSSTFVWQSAVNTPANMDFASIILRNLSASSKGLTLSPPNAMGADYSLVLPSLPGSTSVMTLDASGNMGSSLVTTALINSQAVTAAKIANATITGAQIASATVAKSNLVALGQQLSTTCASYANVTTGYTDVTNLSVTITTSGRPVYLAIIPDPAGGNSNIAVSSTSSSVNARLQFIRGATSIGQATYAMNTTATPAALDLPPSFSTIDAVAAGTYTYKLQGRLAATTGSASLDITNVALIAYEL